MTHITKEIVALGTVVAIAVVILAVFAPEEFAALLAAVVAL
jgi:hypothetical protein